MFVLVFTFCFELYFKRRSTVSETKDRLSSARLRRSKSNLRKSGDEEVPICYTYRSSRQRNKYRYTTFGDRFVQKREIETGQNG